MLFISQHVLFTDYISLCKCDLKVNCIFHIASIHVRHSLYVFKNLPIALFKMAKFHYRRSKLFVIFIGLFSTLQADSTVSVECLTRAISDLETMRILLISLDACYSFACNTPPRVISGSYLAVSKGVTAGFATLSRQPCSWRTRLFSAPM